jgi:hypothetical protein
MNKFWKGVITGVAGMLLLVMLVLVFRFFHERDRKLFEAMEKQHEIEAMQEDIGNRDPYEFLDSVPGVRGAADNAADEFRRKRDEAVQRIRGRLFSGARLADLGFDRSGAWGDRAGCGGSGAGRCPDLFGMGISGSIGGTTPTGGKQPIEAKPGKDGDCNGGGLFFWLSRCWRGWSIDYWRAMNERQNKNQGIGNGSGSGQGWECKAAAS